MASNYKKRFYYSKIEKCKKYGIKEMHSACFVVDGLKEGFYEFTN